MTPIPPVQTLSATQLRWRDAGTVTVTALVAILAVHLWPVRSQAELDPHTLKVGLALAHIIPTQCKRNGGVKALIPDDAIPNGFKFVCADGAWFPETVTMEVR